MRKRLCFRGISFICFIALVLQAIYPICLTADMQIQNANEIQQLESYLDEIYAETEGFTYSIEDNGESIRYDFDDPSIGSYKIHLNSGTGNEEHVNEILQKAENPVVDNDALAQEEEAKIVSEDITKRGVYEKHYIRDDGTALAVSYPSPIHRVDAQGNYVEIDNTLTQNNGRLQNTNADVAVSLAQEASAEDLIQISTEGDTLSWQLSTDAKSNSFRSKVYSFFGKEQPTQVAEAKVIDIADNISDDELALAQTKIQSTVVYEDLLLDYVDVEYIVLPEKIKENIILTQKTNFQKYTMSLQSASLVPVLNADNSVSFKNKNGKEVFILQTPYMYDSADEISYDIQIQILQTDNGYAIDFLPNLQWLQDDDREYPIVIDPTVTTTKTSSNTIDTYVYDGCSASSARANEEKLYIGMKSVNSAYKGHRVYWKAKQLPSISIPAAITNATFYVRCYAGTTSSKPFTLYSANGVWDPATLTWANKPNGTQLQSSVNRNASTNVVTFNSAALTNMVRDWYSGRNGNKGFIIKYTNESLSNIDYNSFYSSENTTSSSYMPYLTLEYELPSQNISNGVYRFRNGFSGYYMTFEKEGNAKANPVQTNVAQYSYIPYSPTQYWNVQYVSGGYYHISPYIDSAHRLDINNAGNSNGTNVKTFTSNGNDAQLFRFISCGNGYYRLLPKNSTSRVVETDGMNNENDTNIQIWNYAGSSHQKWYLEYQPNALSQLIYHTRALPISSINGDQYISSPDYKSGDKTYNQIAQIKYDNKTVFSNSDLARTEMQNYNNMRNLLNTCSETAMKEVLIGTASNSTSSNNMLGRFYNGGGTSFTNSVLTNKISSALANHQYHSKIISAFNVSFSRGYRDIARLSYADSSRSSNLYVQDLASTNTYLPVYDSLSYIANGLAFAIHGWQAHSIEVKSITTNNGKYNIVLSLKFWDIFGLEDTDFSKPDFLYGFTSWYILQHYDQYNRAHRPFITYVAYDLEFTYG